MNKIIQIFTKTTLTIMFILTALTIPVNGRSEEKPQLILDPGGHKALVRQILFTNDEKQILTCCEDKTIKLWDIKTGTVMRTFRGFRGEGHEGKIFAMALSPDERFLAVGGWHKGEYSGDIGLGAIRIFDFKSGRLLYLLKKHSSVIHNLTFSKNGKYLASSSGDKSIIIWNVKDNFSLHKELKFYTYPVYGIDFSPDSSTLASASDDKSIALWDVESGRLLHKNINAHDKDVMSIRFSPDGKYCATGSFDGTVKLWNAKDLSFVETIHQVSEDSTEFIAFSPDGRYLAFGGMYQENHQGKWVSPLYIYDMEKKKITRTLYSHNNSIFAISFSKTGKYITSTGGNDQESYVHSTETSELMQSFIGKGKAVFAAAFGNDSNTIYFGNTNKGRYSPINKSLSLSNLQAGSFEDVEAESMPYSKVYTSVKDISLSFSGGSYNKTLIIKTGENEQSVTLPNNNDTIHIYSLSPDGNYALVGSDFGLYKIEVKTGKILGEFIGHTGTVWAVSVSPDSKYLISGSWDQTMKLWDIESMKLILTIFVTDDNKVLAWTPDFYYMGNRELFKYVGWHLNCGEENAAKYYPFEQFDLKFNRPDIILKRLGYAGPELIKHYYALYKYRLKKEGFTEEQLSGELHLPEVAISNPLLELRTEKEHAVIKISAEDTHYPLKDITIAINNVPVKFITFNKETKTYTENIDLPLAAGMNHISITARNTSGAKSFMESLDLQCDKQSAKPDLYLATIGVSRYKSSRYNLNYADKDALDMTELYKKSGRFSNVHVKDLNNESGVIENIKDIRSFFMKAKRDDMIILFISGHGILEDNGENKGLYYFATHDIDFDKPSQRGYLFAELDSLMENISCINKLFLMDTCFSGESVVIEEESVKADTSADKSAKGKVLVRAFGGKGIAVVDIQKNDTKGLMLLRETMFSDISYGTGAAVISSSSGSEVSFEGVSYQGKTIRNGLFTHAFLTGLENLQSDSNGDKKIQVSEIIEWVRIKVKTLSEGKQHPAGRRVNEQNNFSVY